MVATGGLFPGSTLITTKSSPLRPLLSITFKDKIKSFPGLSIVIVSVTLVLTSIGLPNPESVHI